MVRVVPERYVTNVRPTRRRSPGGIGVKRWRSYHPDWYHSLVANPSVAVEVSTEIFKAEAVVVTGEERERLYSRQIELFPQFGEYAQRTTRRITVVALTPRSTKEVS